MAHAPNPAAKLQHVRPVRPLHFPDHEPEGEHLGQHPRHWALCTILWQLLRKVVGEAHAVSADMFVYWIATDNTDRGRRAPDAAVKLGLREDELLEHGAWKTWELGVPELVVEILSLSDALERWTLDEKRDAYEAMGVREFVCFDLDRPEGARLRVWDRVDGDFVERVVKDDRTPSIVLSLALGREIEWVVAPVEQYPAALRLVDAGEIVATDKEESEQTRRIAEQERRLAEEQRRAADEARARADAAEARIVALEAELARRR